MIDSYPIPTPLGPTNMRDSETELGKKSPGSLVDILNFDYSTDGLTTRDGYLAYSFLFNNLPVISMYAYKQKNQAKHLLAVCGSNIYRQTGMAVAWTSSTPYSVGAVIKPTGTDSRIFQCVLAGTSGTTQPVWPFTAASTIQDNGVVWKLAGTSFFSLIKSGITQGNLWDFKTIADLCIGVDGVLVDQFKFDGTTVYPLAITPPAVEPTATLSGAGVLTGNYQYRITFVSKKGAETNPGPVSVVVNASANAIALSAIPLGGADVGSRNIYRTTSGGTVFYLLDTINDNTTTTYGDNNSDVILSTDIVPNDHDAPPNGEITAVWKEYLWMVDPVNPTRIYHSHQSFPEIFSTDELIGFWVQIGLNDGQNIVGAYPFQNALYVFKDGEEGGSTWPIAGNTPDDFKTTPVAINDAIGLYHRSIKKMAEGLIVGLHRSGIYLFDGYRYICVSDRPQDSIQAIIEGLDPNRLKYAQGFYDNEAKRYYLAVTESGYSYNNKVLVWDRLKDKWTIYDIPVNTMLIWNDSLVFGSSLNGYVHRMGGLSDNGLPISVRAEWPWWGLWDPDAYKLIKYILLDTTQQGDYTPSLDIYLDNRIKALGVWLDDGNLWGSGTWVLEGGTYRIKKLLRINRKRVTAMKVVFHHEGLNQPVALQALLILGNVSGRLVVK